MKVVLAPDSFKESLSAADAAAAMARGVRAVLPDADCVAVPMADGGEGTAQALVDALAGEWRTVATVDALGRPLEARYGLCADGLAVVEVAAAVGIGLIARSARDVMRSTSLGVADLVQDALNAGATRIIVGLGGSATTDGGAGLLAGLGAVWLAADGMPLEPTPDGLTMLDRVDLSGLDPRLPNVTIDLACDVTNPLLGPEGSAAVFGPQKGATPAQVPVLDATLARIADALVAAGLPDVRALPGAGAAGGLGAAFLCLGGRMRRGVEVVADAAHLDEAVAGADLVLTGEGSLDRQTLSGKTPAGVADVAARHGVPVIAFAGSLGDGAGDLVGRGFAAVVPISPGPRDLASALAGAAADLERAVATSLRLWLLGRERR
ncbi:MAG: glycerate kinase [Propionicimonas sp.]|uniref:glycerate kinase n=1 Tax=Propionicimonas sp. TaxID=1955623 RepID=UPI003D0EA698